MDILSIIYIILLVIFAIIGLKKGFFSAIVSFVKGLLSAIASAFLCKPISNWLYATNIANNSKTKLNEYFTNKGGNFTQAFSVDSLKAWAESKNLPEFVNSTIEKIAPTLNVEGSTETLADVLSRTIVYYGSMIIAYIALFLVILIAISIILKIFKKLETKSGLVKLTNRLLGAALYLCFALIIIGLVNYAITFVISKEGSISSWLIETMKLNDDSFTLSKFFYENNLIGKVISYIQQLFVK